MLTPTSMLITTNGPLNFFLMPTSTLELTITRAINMMRSQILMAVSLRVLK